MKKGGSQFQTRAKREIKIKNKNKPSGGLSLASRDDNRALVVDVDTNRGVVDEAAKREIGKKEGLDGVIQEM